MSSSSILGTLVVRIAAEMRQYKADMNTAAQTTADAAAKIERSTGAAGAATGELGDKLGAMRQVAGAASGDLAGAAQGAATLAAGAGAAAVGVGVLLAGLAAVGVAAYKGSQEQLAYQKALILSGNAAGTSAEQMAAMASGISRVVGTQYEAAAALAAMAGTGQVAGANLQKFSQTAIEMERTVGQSVANTVKEFAELGREPVKASLKLNEGMNYLTASTFAQIKAAEDLGDKERAGAIAQNAYADAMKTRTAQIEANLGWLQRAWRGLGDAAGWAWDRMLDLGRERGPETTLAQQKKALANLELLAANGGTRGPEIQKQIDAVKLQMGITKEAIKLGERAGQIQADAVASEKAKIAWMQDGDRYLSKREKMEQAIARIRLDGAKAGASELEIEKRIAEERDEAKGKMGKADPSVARELEKEAALLATLSGVNADYQQQLARLQTMRAKGNITEAQYVELVTQLISRQPVAGKQMAEMAKAAQELATQQEKVLGAAWKSADSIAAQADKQEEANEAFGRGKSALAELTLAQLEKSRADLQATNNVIPGYLDALEQQIAAQKRLVVALKEGEGKETVAAAAKKTADAQLKSQVDMWKSVDDVAQQTFVSIFDSGKSAFDRLRDTLKNGLYSLLYQMTVKKWLINVVASTSGAGVAQQAFGADAGGIMGLANNASSLNSLYSAGSQFLTGGSAGASAASLGYANVVGAVGGDAIGALAAANGGWAGVSTGAALTEAYGAAVAVEAGTAAATAAGAGATAGATAGVSTALAAVPVWGWVALAGIAILGMSGKGGGPKTESGGGYGIGGYMASGGPALDYAKGIEAGYAGLAGQLGLSSKLSVGAFTSQDPEGDSMTQVEVRAALNGKSIYGRGERLGGVENVGRSDEELKAVLAEEATRVIFSALQASDLPEQYRAYLDTMAGSVAGMEAAINQVVAVKQFADALESLPFDNLRSLGFDASAGLLAAAGSLENMVGALSAYYELYYSETERLAQSQKDMARALGSVNAEMPRTKDEFRSMVEALDLNTDAGRSAYVTLLKLAPQFAANAELATKLAQETGAKLLTTFTAGGRLVPALDVSVLKLDAMTGTLLQNGAAAGYVSRLFLDANSGLIGFGDGTQALTGEMTDAQASAAVLNRQIEALGDNTDRARIDFEGLSAALAGVDTETFLTTVSLVFESLAKRITGVIDSIGAERIAVREAALQIINPTAMGKDAILRGILAANVNAPISAGLSAAQGALRQADANVAAKRDMLARAQAQAPGTAALSSAQSSLSAAAAATAAAKAAVDYMRVVEGGKFAWWVDQAFAGNDLRGSVPNPSGERNAQDAVYRLQDAQRNQQPAQAIYEAALAVYSREAAVSAAQIADAQAQLTAATAAQAASVNAAKAAQLAYVASLQDFAIDAGKSVTKLSRLREETVKYYEAQKQLADLMSGSAAGLRKTVADYRYNQLTDAQQFDQLQAEFAKNYAMGLSTDGEVLAGYGDKLNSGLIPLLDKAREVLSGSAYEAFAATTLARSEAIAGRLEALTPTDYAADSLMLLGTIDSTLAALEASSKSAEKIISDAVSAGSEKTASGLRAVIAALTGQPVPAFASGGDFAGGLRIVGENGPELEATGPARIFSASQTRAMLSGGGHAEVVAELRALRQDNASMRAELRAIATTNARLARLAERAEIDGTLVRTDADTPLSTKAVV